MLAIQRRLVQCSALGQSLEQCSADTEYTRPLCSCCSWIDSILAGSSSAWPALHAWRVLQSGCICSSWLACMAPALHAWGILMLYCYSCSSRCIMHLDAACCTAAAAVGPVCPLWCSMPVDTEQIRPAHRMQDCTSLTETPLAVHVFPTPGVRRTVWLPRDRVPARWPK